MSPEICTKLNQAFDSAVNVFTAPGETLSRSIAVPGTPLKITFYSAAGVLQFEPYTPAEGVKLLRKIGVGNDGWFQMHRAHECPLILTVENIFFAEILEPKFIRETFSNESFQKMRKQNGRNVAMITYNNYLSDLRNTIQFEPSEEEFPAPPLAQVIQTLERAGDDWLKMKFIPALRVVPA